MIKMYKNKIYILLTMLTKIESKCFTSFILFFIIFFIFFIIKYFENVLYKLN
jgi:hypothetical protein